MAQGRPTRGGLGYRGSATTYGSVDLAAPNDQGDADRQGSGRRARRAAAMMAFLVLCAATFAGGRGSFGSPDPQYQHSEVFVLEAGCEDRQFVGGCTDCTGCEAWEFAAGGCTYFKNTFCTMCADIFRCPTANVRCTTKFDSTCLECDSGFWSDDCKPCSLCDLPGGYFETAPCTQSSDTVCQQCTQCEQGEWMSKECEYFADRQCTLCSECTVGTFTSEKCRLGNNVANTLGADTVCEPCTVCEDSFWVSDICTIMQDTTCTPCSACPCADRDSCEYITGLCVPGEIFSVGSDTVCRDCTRKTAAEWEVFACGGTSDALFKECGLCQEGEYQHAACTATSDAICPDCQSVHHCPKDHVSCTHREDSVCAECNDPFMGPTCCYQKTFGDCGTLTTRERVPFRYGFEGESNADFVQFCMELCDELPDCLAFELKDGGTNLNESGVYTYLTKESACYFKTAYTKKPEKPEYDCFSNICRQGAHETGLVW